MKPNEIIELIKTMRQGIEDDGLIPTIDELIPRIDAWFNEVSLQEDIVNHYEGHRHDHE